MSGTADFTKMVPGFDFLQSLMKGASGGLPGVNPWIAPTLDPQELDKRIEELRTVQFWLEQNVRLLGATIQTLEVQRMTLSTLQTMNVPLADMHEAMKARPPAAAPAAAPAPAPSPSPMAIPHAESPAEPASSVVDPMKWWGALTQQFTELASKAMQETTGAAVSAPTRKKPAGATREAGQRAVKKSAAPGRRRKAG